LKGEFLKTNNDITRFWSKVQKHKNCCWIWARCKDTKGYGQFRFNKRMWGAHRVAYYLTYGDPGSLCVLHKCDNPSCVRPDHLFLGSHTDNMQDSVKKGRHSHKHTKHTILTPNQIQSIRKLCQCGTTYTEIAKKYGVSQNTIYNISNRLSYRSIKERWEKIKEKFDKSREKKS